MDQSSLGKKKKHLNTDQIVLGRLSADISLNSRRPKLACISISTLKRQIFPNLLDLLHVSFWKRADSKCLQAKKHIK